MKEAQDITALLRHLAEAVTLRTMDNMSRYVKSTGLSMPQISLLMFLKYGGGCGVHDIGTRMGITSFQSCTGRVLLFGSVGFSV